MCCTSRLNTPFPAYIWNKILYFRHLGQWTNQAAVWLRRKNCKIFYTNLFFPSPKKNLPSYGPCMYCYIFLFFYLVILYWLCHFTSFCLLIYLLIDWHTYGQFRRSHCMVGSLCDVRSCTFQCYIMPSNKSNTKLTYVHNMLHISMDCFVNHL